jgi:plastocyanin
MKQKVSVLGAVVVVSLMALWGCSKDSTPTNSGMGNTGREFVSGDMTQGVSFTHVFRTAKAVPYFCKYHGGAGGVGMAGTITVTAGGTPSSHSFNIVDFTLPSATIDVGDTVTWTNQSAILHTVESDN